MTPQQIVATLETAHVHARDARRARKYAAVYHSLGNLAQHRMCIRLAGISAGKRDAAIRKVEVA